VSKNVKWRRSFLRRPLIVTWGLGLAAIYACFGILAGFAALFTLGGIPTALGLVALKNPLDGTMGFFSSGPGAVLILWNLIGLIAVYRAQWPRQIARFTVIGFVGVLGISCVPFLIGAKSLSSIIGTLTLVVLLLLPAMFLMSQRANDYYDR
jgi:hypothetical protein